MEVLQYHSLVRSGSAFLLWIKAKLQGRAETRLETLCRAYALSEYQWLQHILVDDIRKLTQDSSKGVLVRWQDSSAGRRFSAILEKPLDRTVVLKAPIPGGEKGVLLVTFEYNWLRLISRSEALQQLTSEYDIILSASWSPANYHLLAIATLLIPNTVFVQSNVRSEMEKIERFHPRLRCLPTMLCDWLNPAFYEPKSWEERDIDLLVVSNWAPFKRHWAVFHALRELPKDLRVVCIGQPEAGHTLEQIRALKTLLGAPQEIRFLQSLPIKEVTAMQCRSKVCGIFSLREGSCVAATEALMAGASLVMMNGAHVGSAVYINPQTGAFLPHNGTAHALLEAIRASQMIDPRKFALQHVSFDVSTTKVNAVIRERTLSEGRPWTQDIVQIWWRPQATIAHRDDKEKLFPTYASLHMRFPELFSASLIDESAA